MKKTSKTQDELKEWWRNQKVRKTQKVSVSIEIEIKQKSLNAVLTCSHWTKPIKILIGGNEWKNGRLREYHERILVVAKDYVFNLGLQLTSLIWDMKTRGKWDKNRITENASPKETERLLRLIDL